MVKRSKLLKNLIYDDFKNNTEIIYNKHERVINF